jgi:outer membrane protein OmpA-like peptidoglycan-associated protein
MSGRKKGAVIVIASLLLVCVMPLIASAAEKDSNHLSPYLRAGVGPRYLAMGKAGTLASDVFAGYWNPAGLGWMRGWQLGGMYTAGYDYDRNHNYVGVGYGAELGAIALSWINAGWSDVDGYDLSGKPTGLFNYNGNAIQLSLGKSWDKVAMGVSGKMVNEGNGANFGTDDNVTGFGLDVGAAAKINRYFSLGIAAQDLFTKASKASEADEVPAQLRIGGEIYPAQGFTVAMDMAKVQNEENFKFHGGAEYAFALDQAHDLNAALRLGMNEDRFTGGFGVGIKWLNFDYAYVVEPENWMGTNHRLGILLNFGHEAAPVCEVGDRDHDGIPDNVDKCPDQPEDFDGYQDTDGCPDLDNDGDGIPDIQDQCPNQAEDLDGFEDADGCPDLDNDKDGILDKDDKCPGQAEDFNSYEDTDGCPEGGAPVCFPRANINFKFGTDEIVWADPIPVLEDVISVMKARPELIVEIQGHTDNIGSDESNQVLSLKRAEAVKRYIVNKGISAERLLTKGFGESKPIDTNDTDMGRARNRRIEFVVVNNK